MTKETRVDRAASWAKNHKLVSVVLSVGLVVIFVGTVLQNINAILAFVGVERSATKARPPLSVFSQDAVPSADPENPYQLKVAIQAADILKPPLAVRLHCTARVKRASFYLTDQISGLQTQQQIDQFTVTLRVLNQTLTPNVQIIAQLYATEPFKVASVELLPY